VSTLAAAAEACNREVSAAFAPPAPFYPDPCEPGFIQRCVGEPTREQICTHTMAMALRGQVEAGQISEAAADHKLWTYIVSLEQQPFGSGLIINPTREEFQAACRGAGVEPPAWPPKNGWHSPIFMMALERLRKLEPPYCWQSKEALRRIREHLDGDSLLPFALIAYVALAENASNKGAEEFTTLQSHLARLAGGISVRTLQRVLPLLRETGVIDYTTPRLRGPITFRLLAVTPDRRNVAPDRQNVTPGKFAGRYARQADKRNNKEEEKEQKEESTLAQPAADAVERSEVGSDRSEVGSERSNSILSAAQEVSFAEFWKAYPKKRGKAAAQKAWKKLKPPLPKVLETIAAFTASREWRKDNGQFIPYPAGWLNAGRWDDELPVRRNKESVL
jgi:hypothetical protein